MTRRHLLGSAILLGLLVPGLSLARLTNPAPAIQWSACDPELVVGEFPALGERLQCGTMRAPLDHRRPELGDLEIGLVRVRAEKPSERQGVLFFNPGGPGVSPASVIPAFAELWGMAAPDDPLNGPKKALIEQFDLIGVIPRGLPGGTTLQCQSREIQYPYNDITDDRSPANLRLIANAAAKQTRACRQSPVFRFINTEQTAYDMDLVRRALGEAKLNYYGISYGTWLGAWYGAMFPGNVRRMFLDANVDWTSDFDAAFLLRAPERQRHFELFVAGAAATRPDIYGLGTDAMAIASRFDRLPPRVRSAARQAEVTDPANLLAIYTAGAWLRHDPDMARQMFDDRVLRHAYSNDSTVNEQARSAATRFADIYFGERPKPAPVSLDPSTSVLHAVICNDTMSIADPAFWVRKGNEYARNYSYGGSDETSQRCLGWGSPNARLPDFNRLREAGQILMAQAEFDPQTPFSGAMRALKATPNARMVLASGMVGHAVFNFSGSVCVEQAVGRYLLTGEVPSERLTKCSPEAAARTNSGGNVTQDSPRAHALREQIAKAIAEPVRSAP